MIILEFRKKSKEGYYFVAIVTTILTYCVSFKN